MSREACGDPPEQEPQRCPVCDGEWHAEGCELGEEVSRRLKAETEARTLRCRYAVVSGWIVEALKVLDTLDPEDATEAEELGKLIKAGEVLALTALAQSKTPNVRGNAHLTAAQEVEALREVLELCAAGDVDESTEALGWGEVILRAKQALERSTAEAAQPTQERKPLTAIQVALGAESYYCLNSATSAAFSMGVDFAEKAHGITAQPKEPTA